ncbi:MAG TPA: YtxH domain-containing protein [Hanamia sp.]|nr:YtxH domain-containing protein [Hanamia sp.]
MTRKDQITAFILGAAAGVALVRFFNMPEEERKAFCNNLKNKTNQLLDNAEDTVEKVEHYIDEYQSKGKNDWIDKLYVLKKMFRNLYGTQKNYLL